MDNRPANKGLHRDSEEGCLVWAGESDGEDVRWGRRFPRTWEDGVDRLPLNMVVALCVYGKGDLMEGRVDNLARINLRNSIDHLCEGLQHFGVSIGVVGFSIRFVVP
jgi:hypothetical protein